MLHGYEGVVAANTGHISVHEAGAIECTGHKVIELPHHEGKLRPNELEDYLAGFFADENREHMVYPGMVYLSYPTEYGTLYRKEELTKIFKLCNKYEIPLYIDGARLGYGLMSEEADVTLEDISKLCDVFYIGGTKLGALCGEAVVFTKGAPKHFLTMVKQRGALMAKGRLLGVQFDALFTEELYFEISRHAIDMAEQLKQLLEKKRYTFYLKSPTNQQFVLLEDMQYEKLKKHVEVSFWEKPDEEHTIVRFATSWSTTIEEIDALSKYL